MCKACLEHKVLNYLSKYVLNQKLRFKASFKYMFVLLNAFTIISSISPISGHLMTDPIFFIASIAASCTFSCVSLSTSRKAFTICGKKLEIYLGAQNAMFPKASTVENLDLQLSFLSSFRNWGSACLIA